MTQIQLPTVIDFFCGAGGFSEGFRQQGFDIIKGYDHWKPAVDTFIYNFGTEKGELRNILDFESSIDLIEELPNSDVILGSPPCVSFSSSNNSGKADKSLGIRLVKTFLRIVAVKKHLPGSILKAWYMENVTKSIPHLQDHYTFQDLNLLDWCKKYRISPNAIAVSLLGNHTIINSADFGSPQSRKRVISGEVISVRTLLIPNRTHRPPSDPGPLEVYRTLRAIKSALPLPNSVKSVRQVCDPNYPNLIIRQDELSDHFYDTGLYESEWRNSRSLKVNHGYMGAMSFPENLDKPSRTITATKIGTSRESIIYKSEFTRVGNGEYRTPTVREAAVLMSFPITFQFIGSEAAKWRLTGNAVCPSVSRALAKRLRKQLRLPKLCNVILNTHFLLEDIPNLNNYRAKDFSNPPKRVKGSRCRVHPFKVGNLTITLSNYDILANEKITSNWKTSIQYGNGKGFPSISYPDGYYKSLECLIESCDNGKQFMNTINNGFTEKIARGDLLQSMFEDQKNAGGFLEPTRLVEEVAAIANTYDPIDEEIKVMQPDVFRKDVVPKKQLFALYAINKIVTIANTDSCL